MRNEISHLEALVFLSNCQFMLMFISESHAQENARRYFYRPQTKFAKVTFLHLSVSHSVHGGGCAWAGGACMVGGGRHAWWGVCVLGVCGRGHVWWGACVAGEHAWQGHAWWGACVVGVCMAGGMHGGGMHGRGHAWQGGMHGMGACMAGWVCMPHTSPLTL